LQSWVNVVKSLEVKILQFKSKVSWLGTHTRIIPILKQVELVIILPRLAERTAGASSMFRIF
jgi:hypothetical protein